DDNDAWLKSSKYEVQSSKTDPNPVRKRRVPIDYSGNPLGGTTATEAPPDIEEESAQSWPISRDILRDKLGSPCQGRPYYIRYAMKMGWSIEQIHELTRIDPWFLDQMRELVDEEEAIAANSAAKEAHSFLRAKTLGYSDMQLRSLSRQNTSDSHG